MDEDEQAPCIDIGKLSFELAGYGLITGVIAIFLSVTLVFFTSLFTEDNFQDHLPLFWSVILILWGLFNYKLLLRLFAHDEKSVRITNNMSLLLGLEFIYLGFMIPYTIFYVAFPTVENATPRQMSLLFGPIMLVFACYHGLVIARYYQNVRWRDKLLSSATIIMAAAGLFGLI